MKAQVKLLEMGKVVNIPNYPLKVSLMYGLNQSMHHWQATRSKISYFKNICPWPVCVHRQDLCLVSFKKMFVHTHFQKNSQAHFSHPLFIGTC